MAHRSLQENRVWNENTWTTPRAWLLVELFGDNISKGIQMLRNRLFESLTMHAGFESFNA